MWKLKARFYARRFEQVEGIDFTETFAPVVNWTTVRFLLLMSILLGLSTKQVDYVAAFVQLYRIDKVPGENIKTVSTIVMSISRRIWFSKKNTFPDFCVKTVSAHLQTSSFTRFNDYFKSLQSDYKKECMAVSVASFKSSSALKSNGKDIQHIKTLKVLVTSLQD
jgi:hypothetical protein